MSPVRWPTASSTACRSTSTLPRRTGDVYPLRATASAVRFPGFRAALRGAERRPTPAAATSQRPRSALPLPELDVDDPPEPDRAQAPTSTSRSRRRATRKRRWSRASKRTASAVLSTYAPIMSTIQDRGYVEREGRQLKPTELGFVVNDFLIEQFPDVVDLRFTAGMEEELDEIAAGARPWQPTVREIYNPLSDRAKANAEDAPALVAGDGRALPGVREAADPALRPLRSVLRLLRFPRVPLHAARTATRSRQTRRTRSATSVAPPWSSSAAASAPSSPARSTPSARARSRCSRRPASRARRTAARSSSAARRRAASSTAARTTRSATRRAGSVR